MRLRVCARLAWSTVALLLVAATPASASMFSVNPIQIALTGARPSGVLELKNDDARMLRFEIEAFEWKQGPDGEVQLTPTRDIVVFPSLLALASKEERKIRVAFTGAAGGVEKTYRILIQELPPAVRPENEPIGLMMLTHFSIPVFVQAQKPVVTGGLYEGELAGGRVRFRLQNIGNTHFMTSEVKVVGRGSRGEVVFERPLKGWYMLPGASRIYTAQLAPADCQRVKTLAATVRFGDASMTEPIAVSPSACGASGTQ